MTKQIYITRKIPEAGLKLLRENNISYDIGSKKTPPIKKDILKALSKKPYDGVISFLTDKLDSEVFNICPTAKIFANFSVGFDNADTEEAKKRNISITNTPGTSATAVAEHTVALMFALTTRLLEGDRFMRSGKFKGWDPELLVGTDMTGKTIGIIGGGQIGTEVAKMLHNGFNVKIIYSDINPNVELEKCFCVERKETAEILKEADIVTLHIPLLPSTKHLIDSKALSTMKKSAFLINTSRGGVIDEKALVKALKEGVIKGAGLDVYEFEPKLTPGLNKLQNVVLTPHIASSRVSARNMMAEIAAKNIISVVNGGQPINSVIK